MIPEAVVDVIRENEMRTIEVPDSESYSNFAHNVINWKNYDRRDYSFSDEAYPLENTKLTSGKIKIEYGVPIRMEWHGEKKMSWGIDNVSGHRYLPDIIKEEFIMLGGVIIRNNPVLHRLYTAFCHEGSGLWESLENIALCVIGEPSEKGIPKLEIDKHRDYYSEKYKGYRLFPLALDSIKIILHLNPHFLKVEKYYEVYQIEPTIRGEYRNKFMDPRYIERFFQDLNKKSNNNINP